MSKILEIINQFYDLNYNCDLINLKFENEGQPEISINNYVSNFLFFLILTNNFSKCLDIGTLNGKSAMIMAKAILSKNKNFLQNNEKIVVTIEKNEENFLNSKKNFEINDLSENILIYNGDAKEILISDDLENSFFDLIFIDADKASYDFYFEFAKNHINKNGIIILDNVFLHLINPAKYSKDSKIFISIENILNKIKNQNEFEKIIIPYKRDFSEDAFIILKSRL